MEGTAEYQGMKGTYGLVFTPSGKFKQTIHVRRDQIVAFDGRTGWGVDWSGTPRVLQLDDLERDQTAIWVRTARWLDEHGPYRIELDQRAHDDGPIRLRLHRKRGIQSVEIWIDRSTWLPVRLASRIWA